MAAGVGPPVLCRKATPRVLDVVDRLGQPGLGQRRVHLHPWGGAAHVVPDQVAARHELAVRLARVAEHVPQVVGAVQEDEVQGPQSAEVVAQRVGGDEEDLVGLAEVACVASEGGPRRVLGSLWPRGGM